MAIQLGNVPYSVAHKKILAEKDRLRVANQIYQVLSNHLKQKRFGDFSCLDIGCASGVITHFLSQFFAHTWGIDVDQKAIKIAKKKFTSHKLKFILSNGLKLPFPANFFNVVILTGVYSYVSDDQKLMKETLRVLKPGGICYFSAYNKLLPIEPQYKLPFLSYLHPNLGKRYLKLLGYKKIYLGNYKTYWSLKKLCRDFLIQDYTLEILKNPKKYRFTRLYKFQKLIKIIPSFVLSKAEFLLPTFIWILKKPRKKEI